MTPPLRQVVDEYLRRCFSDEETPRVSELATLLGMTRERLSRDFAAAYGVALSAYLKRRQIRHAQRLLAASDLSRPHRLLCGFGTRPVLSRIRRAPSPDQYRRAQNVPSGTT
jgi:transcriptional regulator GlxA family with amidase domain